MRGAIAAARRAATPQPTDKMRAALSVSVEEFDGRAVWHLAPRDGPVRGRLLYFHGGGYIFTAMPPHWTSLADLASRAGIAVTAPLYPLAPESGAEETTGWALNFYRHFAVGTPGAFVMGGDSAGGGLCAATFMAARDADLRLPTGLLLICPWLDVTADHPDQRGIEPRDSILTIGGIRDAGDLYRRQLAANDWRVSPIHGDWSGAPPIQMYGGDDDILVTDARALKAALPAIDYTEGAGLMHDWPLFFFAEAKAARSRMGQWIAERCTP